VHFIASALFPILLYELLRAFHILESYGLS